MSTLSLTPNPAKTSQSVKLTGTGFSKNKGTRVYLDGTLSSVGIIKTDNRGNFQITFNASAVPGNEVITIEQVRRAGEWILVGTITLVVVSAATVPTVPLSLVGVAGNTTAALTWAVPFSNGGSAITTYNVYKNAALYSTTANLNLTVTGLLNGTTYTFTVAAVNAIGEGPKATVFVTPIPPAATVPTVPLNLAGTAGDTKVTLSWSPPTSNGGASITGYKIYRNSVNIATSTSLSYVNTGLTNGTVYSYTVSAVNSVGEGPKTIAISVTPIAAPVGPIITFEGITNLSTTGATVGWTLNEPSTGQVEYGVTVAYGNFSTLETGYLLQHHQVLSGLPSGTVIYFRMRSKNQAGITTISTGRTFTTLTSGVVPVAPSNVTAVSGDQFVKLTWGT